jgi:phosphoglycerol transferase MdoB-like AlkP superfamily enzyme
MHGAAEWIADKEHLNGDVTPSWLDTGYTTADGGGVLLLISIILTGIASRRAGRAPSTAGVMVKIGTVLSLLVLVAFGIAIWAMTTKPT